MEEPEKSFILKCKRCGNEWIYKGKSLFYAPCSICKTSINIKNNVTQSKLTGDQPAKQIEPHLNPNSLAHKITTKTPSSIGL